LVLTPMGWLSWSEPGTLGHFSLLIPGSNLGGRCRLPLEASHPSIVHVSRVHSYGGAEDETQD